MKGKLAATFRHVILKISEDGSFGEGMDAADTFCDYNNDGHIESTQYFASELADAGQSALGD